MAEQNETPVPSAQAVVDKVQEAVKEAAEVKVEDKPRIEITAEEKLAVRELENAFLKATVEVERNQKTIQSAQQQFPALIQIFVKKYSVDTERYNFDAVELVFKKKQ